ncbi:MAG TPA: hypothetical protein VIL23_02850 [Clostridia bacterium]
MKNKDNGVLYVFTRGLTLIFAGITFDMLALPVIGVQSQFWSVILSIAIILAFFYIVFVLGRMTGERCFKAYKRNLMKIKHKEPVLKSQRLLEYHWSKGFLFSSLYYVWQIIILFFALIFRNKTLNLIICFYNLAFSNLLGAADLIESFTVVSNVNALFFIVILAVPLIFEAGYVYSGEKLKKQHQEIKMQIKSFNS